MPIRGVLAHADLDQRQAIAEELQPPACTTPKPGKLLHMPRRSPDDSRSAQRRILCRGCKMHETRTQLICYPGT